MTTTKTVAVGQGGNVGTYASAEMLAQITAAAEAAGLSRAAWIKRAIREQLEYEAKHSPKG